VTPTGGDRPGRSGISAPQPSSPSRLTRHRAGAREPHRGVIPPWTWCDPATHSSTGPCPC
jgi:hypothetical protein